MKLILGTVQLGKKYSKFLEDKIQLNESIKILDYCIKNDILTFDTAQIYGDSEKILSYISEIENVNIITKIHFDNSSIIIDKINKSLSNLNVNKLNTLMFHNYHNFKNKKIVNELIKFKNNKLIENLGVSVYTVNEAMDVLKSKHITVLQIPFNYLDRQWENKDFLELVKKKNIDIHIRSIFLQGLLVNDLKYWPKIKSKDIESIFYNIEKLCKKFNITKIELIVRYSLSFEWITGILFGVDNLFQLKENINLFTKYKKLDNNIIKEIKCIFSNIPNELIDPRLW